MQIGKEIVVLWEEPGHNVVLTHAVGQTGWAPGEGDVSKRTEELNTQHAYVQVLHRRGKLKTCCALYKGYLGSETRVNMEIGVIIYELIVLHSQGEASS